MILNIIVGIFSTGVVAVAAWAVTINSRVAVLEADKVSLKELLETKLDAIHNRLRRIEAILDNEE